MPSSLVVAAVAAAAAGQRPKLELIATQALALVGVTPVRYEVWTDEALVGLVRDLVAHCQAHPV